MIPHRFLLALALGLPAAAPVQAALVTATFTGTVVDAYDRLNNLGFGALVGQTVSATLNLDTADAPALNTLSPGIGNYQQATPWYTLDFQVGGQTLSVDGYATPGTLSDMYQAYVMDMDSPGSSDGVQFVASHGGGVNCWNTPSAYGCTGYRGAQANLVAQLSGQLTGTDLLQLANSLIGGTGSLFYWQGDYDFDCKKYTDPWGYTSATCKQTYRSDGWLSINLDHVSFGAPPAPVPLPGSAPLMVGGLALLGWLGRRRAY